VLINGAQFDPFRFRRSEEHFQGYLAPLGKTTQFPFTLTDQPASRDSVMVFMGPIAGPDGAKQQRLGVDFDVDVINKKILWLSTARVGVDTTKYIRVDYIAYGYV
jgi:hypothetical protein